MAKDSLKNQFYGLAVTIYYSALPSDYRPNGTYQAPTGFVLGSANGAPSTPMEKIYVLTNNYKQVWTVKPEAVTRAKRSVQIMKDGYYLDNSVIYSDEDPIFNNEIKPLEIL